MSLKTLATDMSTSILIVDDEQSLCEFMKIMLTREGYDVSFSTSATQAIDLLQKAYQGNRKIDLVISDLMMPEMSGIDLLTRARSIDPELDFIVMTAFASVETAIEALKKGAFDYVTKPFKVDEVKIAVKKIEERKKIRNENQALKNQLKTGFESFITADPRTLKVIDLARKVADSDATVLILGESGVGKEVLARAIHMSGNRSKAPFVSINCGAVPETLLESELFGHVKGAFSGAIRDKDGLFAVADTGTLFLDEIGETSPAIQVKLLRALEEKIVLPVGATKGRTVDVRIIAATNAELETMVQKGRFRPDLYYRLNVFPFTIPPLRERVGDIPILANYFVKRHCAKLEIPEKELTAESIELLRQYSWPGNVRQLENVLERAVIMAKGKYIQPADMPDLNGGSDRLPSISLSSGHLPELETIEKAYIFYVLAECGWQKSKAAKLLGIDVSTLYRKIERFNLKLPAEARN